MRAIPDLPEIEVVITCKPESLAARVMKRDFEKALSNVVQNAFEAMPNGGELRIECTIVLDTAHPTLVVTVKDTGTGIASRDRSRIFELFFGTKGRMGYGLFDTRTILQTMGGDIVLSPDVTRGSAFTMYVPCELKGA
jgi:signal transduction histidine kinase